MSILASSQGEWVANQFCFALGKMMIFASLANATPRDVPLLSSTAFLATATGVGFLARTFFEEALFDLFLSRPCNEE